jgi:hypothetical protein
VSPLAWKLFGPLYFAITNCIEFETFLIFPSLSLLDIIMDPDFENDREAFCRENCVHFEETDENKLIYTEFFHKYTALVETFLENRLAESIPGFDMSEFSAMLESRKVSQDCRDFHVSCYKHTFCGSNGL